MAQLKDSVIAGNLRVTDDILADTLQSTRFKGMIEGTGVAAQDKGSGVSPRYFPAQWTFNTGFTATDGDIFVIKLPTAGHSNGVFMSVDNGTNYYPISVTGTARLITHYQNGSRIILMFKSDGITADMFPITGGDSRSTIRGGAWLVLNYYDSGNTVPSAYCTTAAGTAAKTASCSNYNLTSKTWLHVLIQNANSSKTALTFSVNGKTAKPIYINGAASSSSNYTLPAGTYLVYYNGTNYYFRTDGKLTADITGNANTATSSTTQPAGDSSTKIATTEFVQNRISENNNCDLRAITLLKHWETKTWTGLTNFSGEYIWSDGTNIYYSKDSTQYVLNRLTSTWSAKTWSGLTSFRGDSVWSDGTNIYYSNGSAQYVLNKSTSTWSTKTWTGLTSFNGNKIWTDGDNIYYSDSSTHRVLDKSTSTWSAKTWSGLSNILGYLIWSDGDNIYSSDGSRQYVLDKSTSTWSTKTWTGLTNFSGDYIWSDGTNIYYSNGSAQYVLNKCTSTWTKSNWGNKCPYLGVNIWTDGIYMYDSDGSTQRVLSKTSVHCKVSMNSL